MASRAADTARAQVELNKAEPSQSRGAGGAAAPEDGRKLKVFVGALSKEISDEEFRAYFETFGALSDATVMRDGLGFARGFGFVTFAEEGAAEKCVQVGTHELKGKSSKVTHAVPRGKHPPGPARHWGAQGEGADAGARAR